MSDDGLLESALPTTTDLSGTVMVRLIVNGESVLAPLSSFIDAVTSVVGTPNVIPVNATVTASTYTTDAADNGTITPLNDPTGVTLTVNGFGGADKWQRFRQVGAGPITVVPGNGITQARSGTFRSIGPGTTFQILFWTPFEFDVSGEYELGSTAPTEPEPPITTEGLLDDFNRTDGPMGVRWSGDVQQAQVLTNKARIAAAGGAALFYNTAIATANHGVSTVVTYTGNPADYFNLIVRGQDPAANNATFTGYNAYVNMTGTVCGIERFVNGVGTRLGAEGTFTDPAGNFTMRLDVYTKDADTVTVVLKVNGTTVLTRDDTSASRLTDGAYLGARTLYSTVNFDDFTWYVTVPPTLTVLLDDFNRADGAIGGDWENPDGVGFISGNQGVVDCSGGNGQISIDSTLGTPNIGASIVVDKTGLDGTKFWDLGFRTDTGQDTGSFTGYVVYVNGDGTVSGCGRVIAGSVDAFIGSEVPFDPGAGSTFEMYGEVFNVDSSTVRITLKVNGTTVFTRTDTDANRIMSGEWVRIGSVSGTTVAFDDFTVYTVAASGGGSSPPTGPSGDPGSGVPTVSGVGYRTVSTTRSGLALPPGNYSNIQFTTRVEISAGIYNFTDCIIPQIVSRFATYVAPGTIVNMLYCTVQSGMWFEGGAHSGWTLNRVLVDGGQYQAVRPKGAGTITINDSLLLTYGTPLQNPTTGEYVHSESMQGLEGAVVVSARTGYSCEPRWFSGPVPTPITAVINMGAGGSGSSFTDCIFGYLPPSGTWTTGGGFYRVYATSGMSFSGCTYYTGSGTSAEAFAPGATPGSNTSPTYI